MKACFMGLGYIGLPTAIIAAKHGVEVIGVDVNTDVVEVTNAGKLHIVEDGLEDLLQEAIASGNLRHMPSRKRLMPSLSWCPHPSRVTTSPIPRSWRLPR